MAYVVGTICLAVIIHVIVKVLDRKIDEWYSATKDE